MSLIQVPTTLLGQVDAAIGGKTAVNLDAGKNLVGTFFQPVAVISDVDLLTTCPPAEMRSGLAEVIKYGFISEPKLLDDVEVSVDRIVDADPDIVVDIVARCSAIKAGIVATDERESGVRAYLNYGHTFAHAIEKLNDFTIRHGEAVALGMMGAAYLARELGRIDDELVAHHRRVIETAGLPTSASLDLDGLQGAWKLDKKYRGGVRFVLLAGLGKPGSGIAASSDAVAAAVERLRP
jgi:3-dehydroquinate synthetase